MTKVSFFLTSLVAAIPAGYLVFLLVFAFMDGIEGLLMIMAGLTALCGIVVGLVIPLGILFFGGKSAATKPAKKQKDIDQADDDEEFIAEGDEVESYEDDVTSMDEEFEETVLTDDADEWEDFEDDDEFKNA